MLVRYLAHPQISRNQSSELNGSLLSDEGRMQIDAFVASGALDRSAYIFSSSMKLAQQTAVTIGDQLSLRPVFEREMDECDLLRLEGVDKRGWLSAIASLFSKPADPSEALGATIMDAQDRIAAAYLAAMERVLSSGMRGDVLLVGHPRIGALLFCYLSGQAIGAEISAPSFGHFFTYDWGAREIVHGWQPMDVD